MLFRSYSASAKLEYGKLQKNVEFESKTKDSLSLRLKTITKELINLSIINLVKLISSIVVSIFALIELVFGMVFLSEMSVFVLSSTALVLAISSHFYKETLTYPEVNEK